MGGTRRRLNVSYYLYAIKSSKQTPCKFLDELSYEFPRGDTAGFGVPRALPRNINTLSTQKYLHNQDSKLHIMALLFIAENVFHDTTQDLRHRVRAPLKIKEIEKTTVLVNPVFDAVFKQIKEPVDTTAPHNFGRFDFISSDHQHFYVHKDILSASSAPFKQMFEPKPQDAQFPYIEQGLMKLENLSAGALNEMLSYIYLAKTTPELSKCALGLVEGANMYGLHGLMALCEEQIIKQTKDMDRSTAFECLQMSQNHNLTALSKASADALESRILEATDIREDVLIDVIEFSRKHDHKSLANVCETKFCGEVEPTNNELTPNRVLHFATISSKYGMECLMAKCGQWFAKNWNQVMANGLRAFVEDNTDGVLMRVLGCALSNK